ncbi:MAG: acyl-CoA dehydrogenase C-terminal domain-containing protein [Tepidamorphaceae bacterium]|nr:acyl-CoA dehydrogenase C-terminal domain-containing protein [Rhodobiaceae bacterium]MCC0050196.1 acyl-CoA dehydrogenase C-terminal domain-containing protein [Rhodobiaceae bacterium]
MPTYKAPVDDALFLLNDVFNYERYGNLPGFADATPDVVKAILEEGGKFAEEVLQPLNQIGDRQGCKRGDDGAVTTPEGFKEAYGQMAEAGWIGLIASPDYGGQGLPYTLGVILNEFISSANMAFGMYPGLSNGAYVALDKHGSDDQKALYLPRLASGKWSGTMNLTEPHCGTDLGLIRTKAVPQGDGSYKITGTKIFISAGEHDLTENIVHLVLARIEGAEEGVKGISLFVVPKFLPDGEGNPGDRNAVECGSLEEKMGIHGNATCVMNYDGATGWLVGEAHKGLRAMFTMMNEARLGVGIQGLAQSEVAYQNAAEYARDRLQGRALTGEAAPDKPADPIIVHPDVRRMLMNQKAFNEAARALVIWSALKADVTRGSHDEAEKQAAEDHMGLLTPVIKGVLTDTGFMNAVAAQQIYGGHGYIAEHGMEQFVRDARIAQIYEGANGIQALDLVGRKLPRDGGRAMMAFFKEVTDFVGEHGEDEAMKPYVEPLGKAAKDLERATMWFMANAMAKPDNAGAGSTDYMHLFGLVALAYMWAMIAKTAQGKLAAGEGDKEWLEAKLVTGRYFMQRILPETGAHVRRIEAGADTMMALPAEAF